MKTALTPANDASPRIVVVAGPNGAGKTTIAPYVLRGALGVTEFVNADLIARGLSGFDPDKAAMTAGRVMLARIHYLAGQRSNFAFETTLSSRTFAPWISRLVREGYEFHLLFFWMSTPEQAIERVRDRVLLGGHNVPEETIRRRYQSGIRNFHELYLPLTTTWRVYNNGEGFPPRLIAAGKSDHVDVMPDPDSWKRFT